MRERARARVKQDESKKRLNGRMGADCKTVAMIYFHAIDRLARKMSKNSRNCGNRMSIKFGTSKIQRTLLR